MQSCGQSPVIVAFSALMPPCLAHRFRSVARILVVAVDGTFTAFNILDHRRPILLILRVALLQWRNRTAPGPTDLLLRQSCLSARKASARMWGVSVAIYVVDERFTLL